MSLTWGPWLPERPAEDFCPPALQGAMPWDEHQGPVTGQSCYCLPTF